MGKTFVRTGVVLALLALLALTLGIGAQDIAPPTRLAIATSAGAASPTTGSQWQRYDLSGSNFQAVDGASGDSVWAAGSDGLLARWNGTEWVAYDNTKIGALNFNGIDVVTSDAAWAVADRAVVRWDGTTWTSQGVGVGNATMQDISMASLTDGWIVGATGSDLPVLARYNGSSWQQVSTPALTRPLSGVDAVDGNNAWAVGGRFGHPPFSEIARWDGTSWAAQPFTSTVFTAVDMLDATYGWAVGYSGALWQWDGTTWTQFTPPSASVTVQDVVVLSRANAWAIASGTPTTPSIWHWDGGSWTTVPAPPAAPVLGIGMLNAGDGWAVGSRGTIYRWDGSAWSVSHTRANTNSYWAVDFLAPNDGWAAGGVDTTLPSHALQHWNGSTWEGYTVPASLIVVDVDMVASNAVWAADVDGRIFRWNGTTWSLEANVSAGIKAISMVSTNEGWAVGGNTAEAAIVHYTGGQWVKYPLPTVPNNLEDVYMVDANDGWAGGIGMMFHFQNGTWTQVSSSMSVAGIHMLNRDEGWAVGYDGDIWHYENGTWTPQASPTTAILEDVHMISPDDGWAVGVMPGMGAPPVLLHYQGSTWSLVPQPTGQALRDVFALDVNEAWAVGGSPGVLLHYQVGPALTPTPSSTRTPAPPTVTPLPTQTTQLSTPTSTTVPPTRTSIPTPVPTSQPSQTPCAMTFTDVQQSDYFYEAVRYLYCSGVISGYSDNTFRPYNNATRGQMTKIVVLAFGIPTYTPPTPTFTDVPITHTFYQYIETAAHVGIVSGYSDGTFRTQNDVTRGQLSKIVVEAAGWPLLNPPTPTFSDVPVGSAFYQYVETAFDHGIISGYADGTFRPGNDATRGQISKIVYGAVTQR